MMFEEVRKFMGDVGFMFEFVKFFEVKLYKIREMVVEVLFIMVLVFRNREKFV